MFDFQGFAIMQIPAFMRKSVKHPKPRIISQLRVCHISDYTYNYLCISKKIPTFASRLLLTNIRIEI